MIQIANLEQIISIKPTDTCNSKRNLNKREGNNLPEIFAEGIILIAGLWVKEKKKIYNVVEDSDVQNLGSKL